jgi:hypothetical protein
MRRKPDYYAATPGPPHVYQPPGRRLLRPAEAVRVPIGVQHAVEPGSATSACGLDAVALHHFPELRFDEASEDSCRDCLLVISPLRAQRNA